MIRFDVILEKGVCNTEKNWENEETLFTAMDIAITDGVHRKSTIKVEKREDSIMKMI